MRFLASLLLPLVLCASALAQGYLGPLDFGLKPADHGRIDYRHTPPNVLCGDFNNDCYPDIARFSGNRLEIYIFQGQGYAPKPQGVKTYSQPIQSLALGGNPWMTFPDLAVTLADGTTDTLRHHGGCLDLQENAGFLPQSSKQIVPPRHVSEFDFQIVWQSEPRPYGMDRCVVGNLDSDSLNELVTWWKDSLYADTAYMLIYKCTGDNQYELFMQEPFWTYPDYPPALTSLLIDDMDQNGHNELIYTLGYAYLWEFYDPGVYFAFRSNLHFYYAVWDIETSDVDQDSIPEIASLSGYLQIHPRYAYKVDEFIWKNWFPEYTYVFSSITWLYSDYLEIRLAVGDFDNDGAVDIVTGQSYPSYGYPWDIEYFRYDTTAPQNFTTEWLYTGSPLTCATPVIADLDNDGQNELFAGGLKAGGGGSAFIWEATGMGTGYVEWQDTTSSPSGPNESDFGVVDGQPTVVSVFLGAVNPPFTQILLWSRYNDNYANVWSSPPEYYGFYMNPSIFDTDNDGKQNIILANFSMRELTDWEQISSSSEPIPVIILPKSLFLYPPQPNPFNNTTIITYDVGQISDLDLKIYDLLGREVFTWRTERVIPGEYQLPWNAENLSSGVYLIRLRAGSQVQVQKAILMK